MSDYKIGDIIFAENCYADYAVGKLIEIKDDSLVIDNSWDFNSNLVNLFSYGDVFKIKECKRVSYIYKFIFKKVCRAMMSVDTLRYRITKKMFNNQFNTVLEWFYSKNNTIYFR